MSAFDTKRTLNQCLLLGVKRTLPEPAPMSAFGPKRTLASQNCCDATSSLNPISQNGQPRKSSRTDGDNRQLDLGASSPPSPLQLSLALQHLSQLSFSLGDNADEVPSVAMLHF